MIFKRHYLKELAFTFSCIICACYFLYVLIDSTSNPKLFRSDSLHIFDIFTYYFYQFSQHGDILVPIALLLSNIHVILKANVQGEFLALQAAGLSLKKVTRPFLFFALFITSMGYLNFEFLQPSIYLKLVQFEKKHFNKELPSEHEVVHALTLEDHSLLIYNRFDPVNHELIDLLWQTNHKELYKIARLDLKNKPPLGHHVEHFTHHNQLTFVGRHESFSFPTLSLPKDLSLILLPPKWQALSSLFTLLPLHDFFNLNDKQAAITTYFLYKLTMPLLTLLVVVAPLCYCTHYTRNRMPFLTYTLALFCYITFFTLLNASVILGENKIFHPLVTICVPMGSLVLLLGYKYVKL